MENLEVSLIEAIKIRPRAFLREVNFAELDAFLRGYSAALFAIQPEKKSLIKVFKNEWLPNRFPGMTDWLIPFETEATEKSKFAKFYQLWEEFQKNNHP